MKIGILSDTHVNSLDEISPTVMKALSGVDLIVHAGDFVGLRVFEGLSKLKQIKEPSLQLSGII